MAASTRKQIKPRNKKSDMRKTLKHRLAVKYVTGQRSVGKRATRAAMSEDD